MECNRVKMKPEEPHLGNETYHHPCFHTDFGCILRFEMSEVVPISLTLMLIVRRQRETLPSFTTSCLLQLAATAVLNH